MPRSKLKVKVREMPSQIKLSRRNKRQLLEETLLLLRERPKVRRKLARRI